MKDRIYKVLLTATALVVLVLAFYLITDAITKYTGFSVSRPEYDKTKTCLLSNDIILYINSDDGVKELKKFGIDEIIDSINIKNCFKNNEYCDSMMIREYPTWIINDKVLKGDLNSEKIIKYLNC